MKKKGGARRQLEGLVAPATKTPREELKSRIAVEPKAKVEAGEGKPAKLTTKFKSPILNFKASTGVQKGPEWQKLPTTPQLASPDSTYQCSMHLTLYCAVDFLLQSYQYELHKSLSSSVT